MRGIACGVTMDCTILYWYTDSHQAINVGQLGNSQTFSPVPPYLFSQDHTNVAYIYIYIDETLSSEPNSDTGH